MAQKETKVEQKKAPELSVTELKQKQSFLNLETGEEDEITVVTKKYSLPENITESDALKLAQHLVQPAAEQIKALLKYAESQSYQTSKEAALAKGNYLTPQVRGKIVAILQQSEQFAEMKAKDVFDRWFAGFKAKKAGAFKVLERARATEEYGDL